MIEALEPSVVYLLPYNKLLTLNRNLMGNKHVLSEDSGIFPDCFTDKG